MIKIDEFREKLRAIDWSRLKTYFSRQSFEQMRDMAMESRSTTILGASIVFFGFLTLLSVFVIFVHSDRSRMAIMHAAELRVLSQTIAKNASEAASGDDDAFGLLDEARTDFQVRWNELKKYRDASRPDMRDVETVWRPVSGNAEIVLQGEDAVSTLYELANTLTDSLPDVQAEYDNVIDGMLKSNASARQIAIAKQQSVLAERILRSVRAMLDGGDDAVVAANDFGRDTARFSRVLKGMKNGDPILKIERVSNPEAIDSLNEISKLFDESVNKSANEILATSPELFQVRQASAAIFKDSSHLLDVTTTLAKRVGEGASNTFYYVVAIISFVFFILSGALLYGERSRQGRLREAEGREHERQRAEQGELENQRNQSAILRLLDELGDLADGDLTVQATVTEDFTGAIADSINYSIDQLRALVSTINSTAVQVSAAAQETQATAMHLAEASEHQAQEIAGASAAVNEMAVSIDQVSSNAAESAVVAERSVAIAHKGAEVVQRTIEGMDNIREQIQETAKRIKHLGESSQEIGDIVSLINDIADQTNILALNAAIQASMAGDAGRGFAVVADEVQRLAERSANATKQIEQLVKTIQTDTNEAVISMEQTTSEVVRGARLAQDAGVALEEIESVSRSLADLIQNISNAARQQAASAGHISNTMNVIQEITSQTTAGTIATARSIGNLAEMANDLRHSVAGFKLPENV